MYVSIVLPILRPMLITSTVLAIAVVKVYADLVVAMTNGGPGTASEVPAKFVMDHLFERANVGLATACATVMLVTVIAVLVRRGSTPSTGPARGAGRDGGTGDQSGGRAGGRRPRHVTWGRVGVYAFLVFSALFFLLPLWIMP